MFCEYGSKVTSEEVNKVNIYEDLIDNQVGNIHQWYRFFDPIFHSWNQRGDDSQIVLVVENK